MANRYPAVVTFRMTADVRRRLKRLADSEDRSLASFIRRYLSALAQQEPERPATSRTSE